MHNETSALINTQDLHCNNTASCSDSLIQINEEVHAPLGKKVQASEVLKYLTAYWGIVLVVKYNRGKT